MADALPHPLTKRPFAAVIDLFETSCLFTGRIKLMPSHRSDEGK